MDRTNRNKDRLGCTESHQNPPSSTQYVLGFLFDKECRRVVLMMKRRPAWQAGCWNGIGGKVEDGENVHAAMAREGREEIGVQPIWVHYVNLEYPTAHLACFAARSQPSFTIAAHGTDERIYRHDVGAVLAGNLPALIPNLRFLIPMAIHAVAFENIVPVTIPVYGDANAIAEARHVSV